MSAWGATSSPGYHFWERNQTDCLIDGFKFLQSIAAYKLLCYRRRNICLRVAYHEAFWEELSRLIWMGRSIRRPFLFWVRVIFFHSLPSRVGCSFQGRLFSIFKLLRFVFIRYYLSSRTALENCVLFVTALRSSWENFFADKRFVLLTQAINLSRLSWCSVWTARENWLSAFASTHFLYPNECQLLDSTVNIT